MHYATPKWRPGSQECGYLCDCNGRAVNWHDPPLMYNIAKDPSETTLLDVTDPKYNVIFRKIQQLLEEHKNSVEPVDNQFSLEALAPKAVTVASAVL